MTGERTYLVGIFHDKKALRRLSIKVKQGWGIQAALDETAELLDRDAELADNTTEVLVRLATPEDLASLGLDQQEADEIP